MAQQVKELAAKSDDLSSISGTHIVEAEHHYPELYSHFFIGTVVYMLIYVHTYSRLINGSLKQKRTERKLKEKVIKLA